jgi:uncharacterized protein (TIGR02996 family)
VRVSLVNAEKALEAGDRLAALDALLAAWRATRSPDIAQVIDVLSSDITRASPGIRGRSNRAFHVKWLEVASHDDPADVGQLLEELYTEPCSFIRERVERLAIRPHDPRIAGSLSYFLSRRPCTCLSKANQPLWTAVFKLLGKIGDVRTRGSIAGHSSLEKAQRALEAIKDPPPLTASDMSTLQNIATKAKHLAESPPMKWPKAPRTPQRSEAQLLAQIYATPHDDAPRLVYADVLSERGDPRGELIVLQCKKVKGELTGSERQREKDLLQENARRWLGALEPVIGKDHLFYERGFVSTCELALKSKTQARLFHDPAWSTVRCLFAPELAILLPADQSGLRSLRELDDVDPAIVSNIALAGGLANIRSVGFLVRSGERVMSRDASEAFPRAECIRMRPDGLVWFEVAQYGWIVEGPWAESVTRIEIVGRAGRGGAPKLAAWLPRVSPRLATVVFELADWRFTATRDGSSWRVAVEPRVRTVMKYNFDTRADVLAGFDGTLV